MVQVPPGRISAHDINQSNSCVENFPLSTQCSNCGEELLGAVNRCWKCGASFGTASDTGGRDRSPESADISRERPIPLEVVGEGDEFEGGLGAEFVDAATSSDGPAQPALPRPPDYRAKRSAIGGAVGSIVLGAIGLAGSFFSAASLFVSLTGLVLGFWGLASDKKRVAAVGLAICVVAVLIGGVQVVTWLYQNIERQDNEAPYEFEPLEEGCVDEDSYRIMLACCSHGTTLASTATNTTIEWANIETARRNYIRRFAV